MRVVKVLGSGCANCKATAQLIDDVARASGVTVSVQKVEEMQAIVAYGVMRTPAVVLDEQVVHAGGVPARHVVEQWLASPSTNS